MSKEKAIPWQDLPTVVELTEESARRQEAARKSAEIMGDHPEQDAVQQDPLGPRPGGWSVENLVREFRFGGDEVPTSVASAAPLLNLAHAIRHTEQQPDVEELRRTTMEAIKRYERDLASARINPERARAAHYVVCATVDDVILSKPWGMRAGWARSGLVPTFHMDVTGGDRVFDLLDYFQQSPAASKDLLLLIYLCLSLAFEGRTRVSARGPLELGRIRDGLYKTLLGQYGIFERELSPHWRGVAAKYKPLRTAVAMWTLLSALVLALAFGYMFFTFSLNRASDSTFERLAGLPPHEAPSIVHLPRAAQPAAEPEPVIVEEPEPAPQEPALPSALENLLAFLQPEVERGYVTLADQDGQLLVRINNAGLFDVGSAEVNSEFRGLFNRIGGALAAEKFRAIVVGYTDNQPMRSTQFPSNWQLSEARAKAVGDILSAYTGPGTIITRGRAEENPIASNETEEGRMMNRRTEILVLTDPQERLSDFGIEPVAPITGEAPQAEGAEQ